MGKINLKQIDGLEILKVLKNTDLASECGEYEYVEEKINYDGNYSLEFIIHPFYDCPVVSNNMIYVNTEGKIWCNLEEPFDETEDEEDFNCVLNEWIKTAKFIDIDNEKRYNDLKKEMYLLMPELSKEEDFDNLIEITKTAKIEYTRWKKLK